MSRIDDFLPCIAVAAHPIALDNEWMENALTTWQCHLCGFIYDETAGFPAEGFSPGTRWADIPDSWSCPDCGYAKVDFEMIEISA